MRSRTGSTGRIDVGAAVGTWKRRARVIRLDVLFMERVSHSQEGMSGNGNNKGGVGVTTDAMPGRANNERARDRDDRLY